MTNSLGHRKVNCGIDVLYLRKLMSEPPVVKDLFMSAFQCV